MTREEIENLREGKYNKGSKLRIIPVRALIDLDIGITENDTIDETIEKLSFNFKLENDSIDRAWKRNRLIMLSWGFINLLAFISVAVMKFTEIGN